MLICLITSCCLSFACRRSTIPLPLLKSGPSAAKNGFERCWSERCWYSLNGDFDVDNNDDRIDGDGFEINLIEMLSFSSNRFSQYCLFSAAEARKLHRFLLSPLNIMQHGSHCLLLGNTANCLLHKLYKLSSTWVSVWVTCDDDSMCFVLFGSDGTYLFANRKLMSYPRGILSLNKGTKRDISPEQVE